jgi:hypothetical protein
VPARGIFLADFNGLLFIWGAGVRDVDMKTAPVSTTPGAREMVPTATSAVDNEQRATSNSSTEATVFTQTACCQGY